MKSVQRTALSVSPAALPGVPGQGHQAPPDTSAWRREMERAQASNWFLGALPARERQEVMAGMSRADERSRITHQVPQISPRYAQAVSSQVAFHRHSVTVMPLSPRSATTLARVADGPELNSRTLPPGACPTPSRIQVSIGSHALAEDWPAPSEHVPLQVPASLPYRAWLSTTAAEVTITELHQTHSVSAPELQCPRRDGETAIPVRVHIEVDTEQATVWMGIDASSIAELPALTTAISRWLARKGYGAPSFVCNGQPMERLTTPAFDSRTPGSRTAKSPQPLVAYLSSPSHNPGEPA